MKRRNFINGIGALAGSLMFLPAMAKATAYQNQLREIELFMRFFRTATGFEPNDRQMAWFSIFKQVKSCHCFVGPRQSGMSLFMMVLAAYEAKVHGKSIYIMPLNYTNQRLQQLRYADIERNVGKSVRDGKVYIGQWHVNGETIKCDYEFHPDSNHHFRKIEKSFGDRLITFNTTAINKIKTT